MKKTLTKVLALLMLATLLVGCFAGCNTSNEIETKPSLPPVLEKPVIDEEVTIEILTVRHPGTTTDAEDQWFFQYMEYWFKEQGYDVNINVTQTNDAKTQVGLLLSGNNLPDLIWGIELTREQIMNYAIQEQMVLDFTPYLNDVLMPNMVARFDEMPEVKASAVAPDNGIYGLPYIKPGLSTSGCYGTSERLYFRQSWLDACGVKNPTTQEEFLDVLRAFKTKCDSTPENDVPLVTAENFLEKYLWTCLGFYGREPSKYGNNIMLKDGQLVLPAYTEGYREFITIMNTMYKEGLISKDYLTENATSAGASLKSNLCGAYCWWTLEHAGDQFKDMVCANPIPMGSVEKVEDIHVSRLSYYADNKIWASSATKYPELIAMLVDFVYSDDGSFLYRYGPKEGEDPLNMVDGWYLDPETKDVTTKLVKDKVYGSISLYGRDILYPTDDAGVRPTVTTSGTGKLLEYTDSVTGKKYTVIDNLAMDPNTNDGHWRLTTIEKWSDRATSIRIPGAYLSPDDTATVTDITTAMNTYITAESAKFITGKRPLSEIDDFFAQLKKMGVEEYMEIMNEVYADWVKEVHAK